MLNAMPGVSCHSPEAAFYLFPDVTEAMERKGIDDLAVFAEKALHAAVGQLVPQADAKFQAGDYTGSLQMLAALRAPVDAFFDGVMVNAEEADLRLNRLGLLALLHRAMNRVADLSRLAA
jgi:glycyl-tRNA synthetase beta subunit